MTARRPRHPQTVAAWKYGQCTGAVEGPTRIVAPILKAHGIPWMWDAKAGCYLLPVQRLDDVLAAVEYAGHNVELRMPGW